MGSACCLTNDQQTVIEYQKVLNEEHTKFFYCYFSVTCDSRGRGEMRFTGKYVCVLSTEYGTKIYGKCRCGKFKIFRSDKNR
jgi:hypothetical protein